jgi:hypothetical protein
MTEAQLDDIRALFSLLTRRESASTLRRQVPSQRLQVLRAKMQMELDACVQRLEELYYKYYIQGRSVERLKTETERDIAATHNTMAVFLPYMMLYNMGAALSEQQPQQPQQA